MKNYDINKIIEYINSGCTISKIATINNVSPQTINYQLKKHGYEYPDRRHLGNNRKCHINKNYFKKVDSKNKAYVLGLIVSDGYVDEKWDKMNFTSKDSELVELIKNELKSKHKFGRYKIYDKRTNKTYIRNSIQISSKNIVSDLNKLGVFGNKSFTSELPNIPIEFMWHFIRGIFDGDGTIHQPKNQNIGRLRFGIVGSEKLLKSINLFLKKNEINSIKIHQTKYCNSKGKLIKLDCSQYHDINIIKTYLYEDSEGLRLSRKYDVFQTLKEYKIGWYDRTPLLRKIDMFNYPTNEFIKTFKNIHEACDEINSTYKQIHRVANGERNHTKGYRFTYR